MNDKKHILVVDDEQEIADLLEVYLGSEGYEVYKYYSAEGVLDCIRKNPIDLALLDVMLPDADGFELCRSIRGEWFFPIIMLTAKIDSLDKIKGITMGADDYITKPFQPLELLARVKGQLRRANTYNRSLGGRKEADSCIFQVRGLEVNEREHSCYLYNEQILLTPMEFNILLYLCRHMGEAVSTEEIFEQVWGEKYLDNNNTVMTHIARIREKLHEDARNPKWIKTVWGFGYRMEE